MKMNIQLASAADDIKVWNTPGFNLVKQYSPLRDNISCVCWAKDSSFLASTSSAGSKVAITHLAQSDDDFCLHDKADVSCISINNSNSRYVVGGGKSAEVHVWDLKTRTLKRSYKDHKKAVRSVQFNWNDTVIASGSESGEIILHNVVSGQASSPLTSPRSDAIHMIQYSCFKRSLLASVSEYGTVSLWDTNVKRKISSFDRVHQAPATALAFSPFNQKLLISVGLDKRIICYDVDDQTIVRTLTSESPLTSLDILYDGSTYVTGTMRGKVFLYDLRKGVSPVDQTPAHTCSVQALKFQYPMNNESQSKPGKRMMSSMKKSQSTSHMTGSSRSQGVKVDSVPSLPKSTSDLTNGNPEKARLTYANSTDRISLDRAAPENDDVAFFSPIREYSTTIPQEQTDVIGDTSLVTQSRGSSYNLSDHLAGGVFSPLAADGSANFSNRASLTGRTSMGTSPFLKQVAVAADGKHGFDLDGVVSRMRDNEMTSPSTSASCDSTSNSHQSSSVDDYMHTASYKTPITSNSLDSRRLSENRVEGLLQPPMPPPALGDLDQCPSRGSPMRSGVPANIPTPPDAMPSTELPHNLAEAHGGGASAMWEEPEEDDLVNAGECSKNRDNTISKSGITGFQVEFVRRIVEDAVDDMKEDLRKDVLNLHMDMLKQFQVLQAELKSQMMQHSLNEELLAEVERLREENKRLKSTY